MSSIEQIIEGLKIFAKYGGVMSAEHDIIYVIPSLNSKSWLSEEDQDKLKELSWSPSRLDPTEGSWYRFV